MFSDPSWVMWLPFYFIQEMKTPLMSFWSAALCNIWGGGWRCSLTAFTYEIPPEPFWVSTSSCGQRLRNYILNHLDSCLFALYHELLPCVLTPHSSRPLFASLSSAHILRTENHFSLLKKTQQCLRYPPRFPLQECYFLNRDRACKK